MNRRKFLATSTASATFALAAGAVALVPTQAHGQTTIALRLIPAPTMLMEGAPPAPLMYTPIAPGEDYNILAVQYKVDGFPYGAWVKLPFSTKKSDSGFVQDALLAYVKQQIPLIDPLYTWETHVTDVKFLYNFDNEMSSLSPSLRLGAVFHGRFTE